MRRQLDICWRRIIAVRSLLTIARSSYLVQLFSCDAISVVLWLAQDCYISNWLDVGLLVVRELCCIHDDFCNCGFLWHFFWHARPLGYVQHVCPVHVLDGLLINSYYLKKIIMLNIL